MLMLFHFDVHHSCKLQCESEAEEGSGPIYIPHGVKYPTGRCYVVKKLWTTRGDNNL
jgi:hypothetical protein